MSIMTLTEARDTLVAVADDLGISVGGTTRGQFGGDVLILSLAFSPIEYTICWVESSYVKSPKEAARLIRGRAKRDRTSIKRATSEWLDSQAGSPALVADYACVEPVGESAEHLVRWRSAGGQARLVEAAAGEGVAIELGKRGDDGYEPTETVPVDASAPTHHIVHEYHRQVLAALAAGSAA